MNPLVLKETEDGSLTLLDLALNETYHSMHGALSESMHVYIENGLKPILSNNLKPYILEIGFGTGLNALLTLDHLVENCQVNYFSLEPYPLSEEFLTPYYLKFENKPKSLSTLKHLLKADNKLHAIQDNFNFSLIQTELKKLKSDLNYLELENKGIDLVYYDAFAPSRQPEMWDMESLSIVSQLMKPGAKLVTYCAQGQFKRNLSALGLRIENPKGAHGKREMTIGIKH